MHAAQQIRDAVKALLEAVPAYAGKVSSSRVHPVQGGEIPCVGIYTANEDVENVNLGGRQSRRLDVVIEVFAKGAAIDDALDGHRETIEAALLDRTLGRLVKDFALVGTSVTASGEGNEVIGRAEIRYRATYQTQHGNPSTLL